MRAWLKSPLWDVIWFNVIFGIGYLPIKILNAALEGDVLLVLTLRFGSAFLTLELLRRAGRLTLRRGHRHTGAVLLIGLLQPVLYCFCETLGLRFFPSGRASVIMALVPVVSSFLGIFLLKEVPTRLQWIFMGISLCGVILLNLSGAQSGGTALGFVLILLTMFCSALNNILVRRVRAEFLPMEITYLTSLLATGVFGVLCAANRLWQGLPLLPVRQLASWQVVACVLFLACGSSVLGNTLRNRALARLPVSVVSGFSGLATVTAVTAGVFLLQERFAAKDWAGMVLVLLGALGTNRFAHIQTPATPVPKAAP